MRNANALVLATGFIALFAGCTKNAGPAKDDSELKKVRQSLQEAERKVQDLTKQNDALRQLVAAAEQKPKTAETPAKIPPLEKPSFDQISFSDRQNRIQCTIHSILVGDEVIDANRIHRFQLDGQKKLGRTYVYFDVSVKNTGFPEEVTVSTKRTQPGMTEFRSSR